MVNASGIVSGSCGSTVVTIRLFGIISSERLEAEQVIAKHRADQLGYIPVAKRGWAPVSRRELGSVAGRHGDNFDGIDWVD